jgi:hypothetical protein
MVTNSWKASVSIVAGSDKEGKTIHASQSTSVSLRRQSVLADTSVQCSSASEIQEATSAIVFTVIVMCAAVNLHGE